MKLKPTLICVLAFIGTSVPLSSAYADSSWKKSHHGKSEWKRDHDDDRDRVAMFIHDDDRVYIRQYIGREYAVSCPPGLAKKHNGCRPPGHAKRYVVGQVLPTTVIYEAVPSELVVHLQPVPVGYQYVMVDRDVLLISEASKKVIDAVTLLSAVGH